MSYNKVCRNYFLRNISSKFMDSHLKLEENEGGQGEGNQAEFEPLSSNKAETGEIQMAVYAGVEDNQNSQLKGDKGVEVAEENKSTQSVKVQKFSSKIDSEKESTSGSGNANGKAKQRQNLYGSGLYNNVPPMSFGLDEHGKPHFIDLMDDLGDIDKEGEELMEKISGLLDEMGIENDDDDLDNRSQNVGVGLPNIKDFLQHMGVNMGQQPVQQPENLQQAEELLQSALGGNQGFPSVEQMMAQLARGGMGNVPGGQNPFQGQGGQGK